MISERIKEVRTKSQMSQAELAKKLGITRSSVNAWEMGVSVPSLQYLLELTKTFKVSADYLLGIDDAVTINVAKLQKDDRKLIMDLVRRIEIADNAVQIVDMLKADSEPENFY